MSGFSLISKAIFKRTIIGGKNHVLFLLKTPWLPALVSHVHSPLLKTAAWLSLASSGQSKTAIGKPDSGAPESSLTGETQL